MSGTWRQTWARIGHSGPHTGVQGRIQPLMPSPALKNVCPGQGAFLLVVAGPGFEPGKAKPTVLQTAPFGRSGNLPCAAPQDGTVKDSGPSGACGTAAMSRTSPGLRSDSPAGAGGQCRPAPRPRGRRD